ncbi:hypothetical protein HY612_02910 [Candidatus Roizmanbacteria bacterium]|nr:hypothetical protein [Candidatus Roizmanbacteria bacterium]
MTELRQANERSQSSASLKNDFDRQPNKKNPTVRSVFLGERRIIEDREANFLSAEEAEVYRQGFKNWQALMANSEDKIEKMILTSARPVSCLVGLQPISSLEHGEGPFLNDCLNKAGGEIKDGFCFLRNNDGLILMVNLKAAELILRKHQVALGLSLAETLSRDKIVLEIVNLISSPDQKRADLAAGLLSGYPLKDCVDFINKTNEEKVETTPWQRVRTLTNPDLELPQKSIADLNWERYTIDSNRNLDFRIYEFENGQIGIHGLGLLWFVENLSSESIAQIQKLWQVDRELGLIDAVAKERRSFSYEGNFWRIKLVRLINTLLTKKKSS